GLASGLVYKLFEKKNVYLAVVLSAIACPLVNTGVFLLGGYIFFFDTIKEWGLSAGFTNVGEYMILGLVGINFLLELAVNVVLSPIIVRIINVRKNTK
ncbi:MAG: ECF transporter S component, partial [Clostridia bacterium]|nr:ECF transporter S component [Clostridia bacterium]